jgi:urease accessory protein
VDRARTAVRSLTDTRAAIDVGRHARLELVFGVRRGRTELLHAYAEPPFRVGRTLRDGDGVHLILASTGPGIFGGDVLTSGITVEAGARVRLTTQSSLQVHPSREHGLACLTAHYRVQAGGHLRCMWDPVITFPGARLQQRARIEVAETGTLFWSDAFMAGRAARGERWAFDLLDHEAALVRAGELSYLERYRITPADSSVNDRWRGADASYFGTVLASDPGLTRERAEALDARLQPMAGVTAGADLVDRGLILVRLMGASGPAFHHARQVSRQP